MKVKKTLDGAFFYIGDRNVRNCSYCFRKNVENCNSLCEFMMHTCQE